MTDLGPELRATIAADFGLSGEAARFLVGSTVAELESSAASLVRLVGQNERQESPATPAADLFAGAGAAKVARQRAPIDSLTGRAQSRDEHGRFASGSGFDGGARASQPVRAPETHDQTLSRLLLTGEANAGCSL